MSVYEFIKAMILKNCSTNYAKTRILDTIHDASELDQISHEQFNELVALRNEKFPK